MASDGGRIRNINRSQAEVAKLFDKLSSGKRITRASDDAAGLAIATQLATTVQISSVGKRNIGDAQSALQIADGALGQLSNIGVRLGELATQSANGTLSDTQRTALNQEFQQLTEEAQRIAGTTQFNGTSLLGGSGLSIQAGVDASANSQIQVTGTDGQGLTSGLTSLAVGTASQATSAIDGLSSFVSNIASARGSLGASGSRLDSARTNLESLGETSAAARSRIEDLDVAEGVAKLTAAQIRLDAGTALKAQTGGLSREVVLRLLS